jgi:sugar-specific transcriptional regulator TrmB
MSTKNIEKEGVRGSVNGVQADRVVEFLKDAGMSGYEAKAYVALLAAGEPANGYEVAKASGVPRSTVYETIAKLVARGAAFEVNGDTGAGVSYVALPADALIGRLRRQALSTIEGLERVLPEVGRTLTTRVVQHLTGIDEVLDRGADVVDSARETLWLSIWPEEAASFTRAVDDAIRRRVETYTIAYGDVGAIGGRVYQHSFSAPDLVLERLKCRISVVVADHDEVVIAGVTDDEVWGIWSDDPAVALLAAEHVRHDIALQLIAERMEAAGLQDYWLNDPELEQLRRASRKGVDANRPARQFAAR